MRFEGRGEWRIGDVGIWGVGALWFNSVDGLMWILRLVGWLSVLLLGLCGPFANILILILTSITVTVALIFLSPFLLVEKGFPMLASIF